MNMTRPAFGRYGASIELVNATVAEAQERIQFGVRYTPLDLLQHLFPQREKVDTHHVPLLES
jgi:hypothetical protein